MFTWMKAKHAESSGDFEVAADLYTKAGNNLGAGNCLELAANKFTRAADDSKSRWCWKRAGHAYRKGGRVEDAIRCYRKSDSVEAGELLNEIGRSKDALEYLMGQSSPCHHTIADVYMAMGDIQQAVYHYDKGRVFWTAQELYSDMGDNQNAARCFKEMREYENAADLFLKTGNLAEAADCYSKHGNHKSALDLYLKLELWSEAAICAMNLKQFERALELWESSTLDLKDYNIAECYKGLGRYLEAARVLGDSEYSGEVYLSNELWPEAARCFESNGLLWDSVYCYYKAGKHGKVSEILNTIRDLRFSRDKSFDMLQKGKAHLALIKAHPTYVSEANLLGFQPWVDYR